MSSGSRANAPFGSEIRAHYIRDFMRCEYCGKLPLGAGDILCSGCRRYLAEIEDYLIQRDLRNVLD